MFTVLLNNQLIHEFNVQTRLPGHVRSFLDRMDADMEQGIKVDGEQVTSPDEDLKLKYVVHNLLLGLKENNKGLIQSTSTYLGSRYHGLASINVIENDGETVLTVQYTE